jgi:hypothetical protein
MNKGSADLQKKNMLQKKLTSITCVRTLAEYRRNM